MMIMTYATTMTSKGQITIPVAIRTKLGLMPNARFVVRLKNDTQVMIERAPTILDIAGSFRPKKAHNAVALRGRMEATYRSEQ